MDMISLSFPSDVSINKSLVKIIDDNNTKCFENQFYENNSSKCSGNK